MNYAVVLLVAYLVGSVPVGLLVGRLVWGIDIRKHGSGKTGTSNVLRTLGPRAAAFTLLGDVGKGVLAVFLARSLLDSAQWEAGAALMAAAGHTWPLFLRFRGGRGVAPAYGGLLLMAPLAALIATVLTVPIIARFRYMSLGSITGVTVAALAMVGLALGRRLDPAYLLYALMGAPILIGLHWDNILRLLRGTERRLGESSQSPPPGPGQGNRQ